VIIGVLDDGYFDVIVGFDVGCVVDDESLDEDFVDVSIVDLGTAVDKD